MSKKMIYLCHSIIVLTKKLVFKNFLTKLLFTALVLFFLSSFTEQFPEPTYYEINFGDDVIHLWSRQVYYDHYGFEKVTEKVTDRYNDMEESEINFFWSEKNYHDTRDAHENLHRYKSNVILWEFHPNYKESLDKYCYIIIFLILELK